MFSFVECRLLLFQYFLLKISDKLYNIAFFGFLFLEMILLYDFQYLHLLKAFAPQRIFLLLKDKISFHKILYIYTRQNYISLKHIYLNIHLKAKLHNFGNIKG